MRSILRAWVLLGVVVGAVAACTAQGAGSTSGSSGGSSGTTAVDAGADAGPLTADLYCEATMEAFCAYYVRCGRMAVDTVEACRTVFLESCNARYEDRYAQLAERGLIRLSSTGVAACRAHLATVECAQQVRDLDGPCGQMWVGTSPVGSACGLDVESLVCAEGAACVLGLDFCGSCRALSGVGQPCGDGVVTCGNGATCRDGTCVERVAVGQPCADGDTCVLGASCVQGVCTAPSYTTVGQPCGANPRCPYKSACVGGVCVEAALQGEPCGAQIPCASGFCAEARCQAPRSVGEACSAPDQCRTSVCSGGVCRGLPGACFVRDGGL